MKVLELRLASAIRVGEIDGVMFAKDEKFEIEKCDGEFLLVARNDSNRKISRVFPTNVQYYVLSDDQLRAAAGAKTKKLEKVGA